MLSLRDGAVGRSGERARARALQQRLSTRGSPTFPSARHLPPLNPPIFCWCCRPASRPPTPTPTPPPPRGVPTPRTGNDLSSVSSLYPVPTRASFSSCYTSSSSSSSSSPSLSSSLHDSPPPHRCVRIRCSLSLRPSSLLLLLLLHSHFLPPSLVAYTVIRESAQLHICTLHDGNICIRDIHACWRIYGEHETMVLCATDTGEMSYSVLMSLTKSVAC